MRILKTVSARVLKVSSDQRRRTYTIRTESAVYRTLKMTRQEFESYEDNTCDDWQVFLKTNDAYYVVRYK